MVDLHNALRPTGAVPPLPVSEIAVRVRRRKRRRAASATGMAVATLSVAAFIISSLPGSLGDTRISTDGSYAGSPDAPSARDTDPTSGSSPQPSIIGDNIPTDPAADPTSTGPPPGGPDDTTASPEDTEAIASSIAPRGTEPTEPPTATTPGIRTSATTTSNWEDGYCIGVEVINDTVDPIVWHVVLDLEGTIATKWNTTLIQASNGNFVFSGEGFNSTIQPGAVTSFGICLDTGAD